MRRERRSGTDSLAIAPAPERFKARRNSGNIKDRCEERQIPPHKASGIAGPQDREENGTSVFDPRCSGFSVFYLRLYERTTMFYFALFLVFVALTAAALFYSIRASELSSQMRKAAEAWRQKEEAFTSELDKLEKIRHIPDIFDRARKAKEQVEAKLAEAQRTADEIIERAIAEARDRARSIAVDAERKLAESKGESQKILADAEALNAESRGR